MVIDMQHSESYEPCNTRYIGPIILYYEFHTCKFCINDSALSAIVNTEIPINDPTTPLFPLRVAAELTNTSVYSLRQYVDLGLIIPFKTPSNRRLYSHIDLQRILCIRKYLDEHGLNIAGIKAMFAQVPCWLLKPCSAEDRESCDAYESLTEPCWQVSVKGPTCKNEDCRTCTIYRLPEKCSDLKSIFKTFNNLKIQNN